MASCTLSVTVTHQVDLPVIKCDLCDFVAYNPGPYLGPSRSALDRVAQEQGYPEATTGWLLVPSANASNNPVVADPDAKTFCPTCKETLYVEARAKLSQA